MARNPVRGPVRVPLDVREQDPRPPREPDLTGTVVRGGVSIPYAVHGASHRTTVVLLPTWTIVPSRIWKFQVPYLARSFRVVTFEGRGSAEGPRPRGAAAYRIDEYAEDTLAVMDAAGVDRAVLVGFSMGGPWAARVAADHPDRVDGLVLIAHTLTASVAPGTRLPFLQRLDSRAGWDAFNRYAWTEGGWEDFIQFFFGQLFSEPHSTKAIEDTVRWAVRTTRWRWSTPSWDASRTPARRRATAAGSAAPPW